MIPLLGGVNGSVVLAAENPNDRNAVAQVATGIDLLFLFRHQR
jgi:hypothetical protein